MFSTQRTIDTNGTNRYYGTMSTRESGYKRKAFTLVIGTVGYRIGLAVEGEPGYTPCPHELCSLSQEEVRREVGRLNGELGVSDHEAWEIVASTMAGNGVRR